MAFLQAGLNLESQLIGGLNGIWFYRTTDTLATVLGAGYFALMGRSVKGSYGMQLDDEVRVLKTDDHTSQVMHVSAIDASGNVTVAADT